MVHSLIMKKKKTINSKLKTQNKLKAAVVGVGSMGRHHARNYADMKNVDLVAVCDPDEAAGKKIARQFNTKYYKDHTEMFEAEKPDLVTIAAPTKWHHPIALDAIKRKIHILIEKPITLNLDEAQEIINEAKGTNTKITVGHIERFNPAVIKLKELIKGGKLGSIISIMARRAGAIPERIKDANVILDIGVHDIDLLNFILERSPINVFASGGRAILKKHEDYADIFLEYPSDANGLRVTGHIQVNWLTPLKIRKLNVTGTKGYAVVNLVTQELVLFDTNYTQEFDDFEDFVGKFKGSKGRLVKVTLKEPLRVQLEQFVHSIATGSPIAVAPEEALSALRTAILATETIRIKDGGVS